MLISVQSGLFMDLLYLIYAKSTLTGEAWLGAWCTFLHPGFIFLQKPSKMGESGWNWLLPNILKGFYFLTFNFEQHLARLTEQDGIIYYVVKLSYSFFLYWVSKFTSRV